MTAPNPRTPGWSHHWRTGWSHDWRNSGPITLAELLPSGPIPLAGDKQAPSDRVGFNALSPVAVHEPPVNRTAQPPTAMQIMRRVGMVLGLTAQPMICSTSSVASDRIAPMTIHWGRFDR